MSRSAPTPSLSSTPDVSAAPRRARSWRHMHCIARGGAGQVGARAKGRSDVCARDVGGGQAGQGCADRGAVPQPPHPRLLAAKQAQRGRKPCPQQGWIGRLSAKRGAAGVGRGGRNAHSRQCVTIAGRTIPCRPATRGYGRTAAPLAWHARQERWPLGREVVHPLPGRDHLALDASE